MGGAFNETRGFHRSRIGCFIFGRLYWSERKHACCVLAQRDRASAGGNQAGAAKRHCDSDNAAQRDPSPDSNFAADRDLVRTYRNTGFAHRLPRAALAYGNTHIDS